MEVIERFEHAGLVVTIVPDHEPPDPRDCDQLGIMYCWHPDYELGDEQFTHADHPNTDTLEDVANELREERDAIVVLPLALLDHSGLSMSVGSSFASDPGGWDTTRCGFIFTTEARCRELGVDPTDEQEIERQLRGEVTEYDHYLIGRGHGYIVETPEGAHLNSLWGFLGYVDLEKDESGVVMEAKAAAEHEAKCIEREHDEAAEWAARDVVTVDA